MESQRGFLYSGVFDQGLTWAPSTSSAGDLDETRSVYADIGIRTPTYGFQSLSLHSPPLVQEPEVERRLSHGSETQESSDRKSPLEKLSIFKGLSLDRKTKDGQPQKRRGPKPDSKPATTRRQELNRQAQRSHRERKEMYLRALEQENINLKKTFGENVREKEALAAENRRLKELLSRHGIYYDGSSISSETPSLGPPSSSTGLSPPSHTTDFSPPPITPPNQLGLPPQQGGRQGRPDMTALGMDFILTLERPCQDHVSFLINRSWSSEEEVNGHVLMATVPSQEVVIADPTHEHAYEIPALPPVDLTKLLECSMKLDLNGELTPVMAWGRLISHPRAAELTAQDIAVFKEELVGKVRCYGFGAVMEEFEVADAIERVFVAKQSQTANYWQQELINPATAQV